MYWKYFCSNSSIRIAYKWHHSRISLCISQTGTTQTASARHKGGKFIGQLCMSVVPHSDGVYVDECSHLIIELIFSLDSKQITSECVNLHSPNSCDIDVCFDNKLQTNINMCNIHFKSVLLCMVFIAFVIVIEGKIMLW